MHHRPQLLPVLFLAEKSASGQLLSEPNSLGVIWVLVLSLVQGELLEPSDDAAAAAAAAYKIIPM